MGVYIKNMEMPTSCQECPLKHRGFNGSETVHYCYAICKEVSDDGEIDADCPLVPVPPHGRLIDADALMDQIVHDTPLSAVFEKTMRRYLRNAPTIIPAEEGDT